MNLQTLGAETVGEEQVAVFSDERFYLRPVTLVIPDFLAETADGKETAQDPRPGKCLP